MDTKETVEIIAALVAIIGAVGGLVTWAIKKIQKIKENRKLKLNKDDGCYYDKKGKEPYCPQCYESKKLKAHINNGKCDICGKVYKYPPVVIAVCPPPPRKLPTVK